MSTAKPKGAYYNELDPFAAAWLSELAGRLWGNNVWLDLAAKQNLHLILADKQKAADSYE